MVTVFEVAGLPLRHGVALEVSVQVTASPLTRVLVMNVALFVPSLLPLTFHWYTGVVPPLTGVAVKVTGVPAQIVVLSATMPTEAVRIGLTVMVTVFEVAGLPLRHGVALEVSVQVTASPLPRVLVMKVALFVPALLPLTFHW